ncbi:MAG: DUF3313 family protein [Proteobacteria bacterium]|nr:DUF3313 family protein [Pseudomonadota bacterium]
MLAKLFPAVLFPAVLASTVLLGACAQNTVDTAAATPEKGDADFMVARNSRADQLYVNMESAKGGSAFRKIFIAPVNDANIQIIQPEGTGRGDGWDVNDIEDGILQNAMAGEFSKALSYESAFNVVNSRAEADMVVHTTIVAIHPNASKSAHEAGGKSGGAVTVSLALINAATGEVMVRSVDTKSTDNIWAFNNLETADPAVNLIFKSWGNSMRRGILHLQGRSVDPAIEALQLKPQ